MYDDVYFALVESTSEIMPMNFGVTWMTSLVRTWRSEFDGWRLHLVKALPFRMSLGRREAWKKFCVKISRGKD